MRQSPSPIGSKTGAAALPIPARIPVSGLVVSSKSALKFSSVQITVEAVSITVNAFLTKPSIFSKVRRRILWGFGYRRRNSLRAMSPPFLLPELPRIRKAARAIAPAVKAPNRYTASMASAGAPGNMAEQIITYIGILALHDIYGIKNTVKVRSLRF